MFLFWSWKRGLIWTIALEVALWILACTAVWEGRIFARGVAISWECHTFGCSGAYSSPITLAPGICNAFFWAYGGRSGGLPSHVPPVASGLEVGEAGSTSFGTVFMACVRKGAAVGFGQCCVCSIAVQCAEALPEKERELHLPSLFGL